MSRCGDGVGNLIQPQVVEVVSYQVNMNDLVRIIFVQNTQNAKLTIGLDENQFTPKRLFMFLVDILVKGCITFFGQNNNLNLSEVKHSDLEQVIYKMSLAGFRVHMGVVPCDLYNDDILNDDPASSSNRHKFINKHVQALHDQADDLPLEDYKFVLIIHDDVYIITFTAEQFSRSSRMNPSISIL